MRTRIRLADCDRMGVQTALALDPRGQHLPFSAGKAGAIVGSNF
jgi:hypothetical protein